MMTLNLWRAEWLKTRKRLLNRGLIGIMLVIVLVIFVVITGMALFNPGDFLAEATEALPFPQNLGLTLEVLASLGPLLVVVFVANSVGSEYGRDTWKVILPRHGSRTAFLLTKWVVGLVALLLLIAGVVVSSAVFGWLGALILGITPDPSSASDTAMLLRSVAVLVLDFIFVGTLTFFGAVVTRSTIGAAMVGILVPVILALLGPALALFVTGVQIILPTEHLDNLRARWVELNAEDAAYLTFLFDRSVPPFVSALVVVGYIAVLLGASLYLFKRRDMAGE